MLRCFPCCWVCRDRSARTGLRRFFARAILRRAFRRLTHPVPAWLLFAAATWIWHLPPTYELALASDGWHYLQHICFLVTALLFWYPVVRPFPSHPRWSPWLLVPYLILADVQNTLLAAWLTFSSKPLYPYYVNRPRLGNLSPLEDQAAAGVLMWVPGSLVYLVPLFVIGIRLLFGNVDEKRGPAEHRSQSELSDSHHRLSPFAADHRPAHSSGPAGGLRSLARPAARSLSPLAACPDLLSASALFLAGAHHLRRLLRPAHRRHESGGRAPLDSLAWTGGPGVARAATSSAWPAHSCCRGHWRGASGARSSLAALAQKQMAGDLPARRLSVGVRGVRSLGQSLARPPPSSWRTSRRPS